MSFGNANQRQRGKCDGTIGGSLVLIHGAQLFCEAEQAGSGGVQVVMAAEVGAQKLPLPLLRLNCQTLSSRARDSQD